MAINNEHKEDMERILVEMAEDGLDSEHLAELEDDPAFHESCQNFFNLQTVIRQKYHPIDVERYLRIFHHTRSSRLLFLRLLSYAACAAAAIICFLLLNSRFPTSHQAVTTSIYSAQKPQQVTLNYGGKPHTTVPKQGNTAVIIPEDYLLSTAETQQVLLNVPYGNCATVTMPDGSVAYLHAGSSLTFATHPLNNKRVAKLKGEAYLKIKHDPSHPFIILTGHTQTTVLGTELNICVTDDNKTIVTLITGKAKESSESKTFTMAPGQQATVTGKDIITREVDVAPFTNWRDGYFYFDNVPLKDIMETIGKHYNMTVIFKNTSAMHYKTHFVTERSKNIDAVVNWINQMDKVKVSLNNGQIIID